MNLELVGQEVDNKIRFIAIGDDVDTAEEDWQERLQEAQQHHCRDNRDTRRRIKRAFEDLWEMGAALGPLRPGYVRRPMQPATATEPAEGPYYDDVDPRWAPVVHEAFRRIAGVEEGGDVQTQPAEEIIGEPPWSVAIWLTEMGLPKTNNWPGPWTAQTVIVMIKMESYRGEELYRKTKSVKKFVSGKSKQERNDEADVKRREMPHYRMVPDWLHQRANQAIKNRTLRVTFVKGDAHPLSGIPRDSRKPLSRLFVCGICEQKMYAQGRIEGGYRCGGVEYGTCWNHATALRDVTHQKISRAIAEQFMPDFQLMEGFVEYVSGLVRDDDYWREEEDRLNVTLRGLLAKCDRIGEIIESCENPSNTLIERLAHREAQVEDTRASLEQWRRRRQACPAAPSALVSGLDQRGGSPRQGLSLNFVTERNCVAARRGGEQREVKGWSVG